MPNFFHGEVRIFGDDYDQLAPILEWTDNCNTACYENGVPFNSLLPLTSMDNNYDDEKWVYEEAIVEWGSKWGVAEVAALRHTTDYVAFHYQSAWNMPDALFRGIEEKYGVKIYSHGYEEGCGFYTAYVNGATDTISYDQDDFNKWAKDKGLEVPDYEKDSEEYNDFWDDKILNFLNEESVALVEELNGGRSCGFKTYVV